MNDIIFYDMMKYVNLKMKIEKLCCLNDVWLTRIWKCINGMRYPMPSYKFLHNVDDELYLSENIKNKLLLCKLIKNNSIDVYEEQWVIKWSSKNGYKDIVELLLKDDGVDPTYNNNNTIVLATFNGNIDVVKLLLMDGRSDPSAKDNCAIHVSSRCGHIDIVKLLLNDIRVNPCANNNYAIRKAFEYERRDIVKLLLKDERVNPL